MNRKDKKEQKQNEKEMTKRNGTHKLDNRINDTVEEVKQTLQNEIEDIQNELEKLLNDLKNKNEKIKELELEIADYKDKLLRKAAEFENYKRRTENDQLNILKYSGETFILKLLPVVDDFERSLAHIDNAKDVDAVKKGIRMVYNKLKKILEEQGVKVIESIGKHFDVDYHEAMMQRKDDSVPGHTVLDEIEKGYLYKDKVIRHTKVIVSEAKAEDTININSDDINKNGNEDS
ncbi:MAG TPA: nucleotide exchange factor GrpE [Ignavibacteria bacterium]|nr:nucleotide exchange factor GrpE [Ignavibacteria bacterium]